MVGYNDKVLSDAIERAFYGAKEMGYWLGSGQDVRRSLFGSMEAYSGEHRCGQVLHLQGKLCSPMP